MTKALRSAALLLVATVAPALAQVEVKGVLGTASFLDDGNNHLNLGGAARFYLVGRFSVEAEVAYLRESATHNDVIVSGNVAYDLRSLDRRVVPYVVAGAGGLWSRYSYFASDFSGVDPLASGGGGVKIYFAGNWFAAPEFRIGWPPHGRFTVAVGYTRRSR
ncbi:MAG TPA: outer membrane beta-barrel protein [Bryobacteraceae bacterium]|nr:outer membrane beta-barrel protein [Bryobacteraceae bacterium]